MQSYRLIAIRPGKAESIIVMQGCKAEAALDAVHKTMNSKVATIVFFLLWGKDSQPNIRRTSLSTRQILCAKG
jgi:hypothetical protein